VLILAAILQTLLLPLAGYGLFRWWKKLASAGRWTAWFITAGFLSRAILGIALFWISFLGVIPLEKQLDDGNGFWFFSWDGRGYFHSAVNAIEEGPSSVIHFPESEAAKRLPTATGATVFVQVLAVFCVLFGKVASVGLMLNAVIFFATCTALLALAPKDSRIATFAVGAYCLAPSLILWATQPLKDVMFLFLLAAFAALAALWQDAWRRGETTRAIGALIAIAAGILAAIYGISGIRWYYGVLLLALCIPFFLLTSLRGRTWKPAAIGVLLLPLMAASFLTASGHNTPPIVRTILTGGGGGSAAAQDLPQVVADRLVEARKGFGSVKGNTDIGAAPEEQPEPQEPPKTAEAAAPARPAQRPATIVADARPPAIADPAAAQRMAQAVPPAAMAAKTTETPAPDQPRVETPASPNPVSTPAPVTTEERAVPVATSQIAEAQPVPSGSPSPAAPAPTQVAEANTRPGSVTPVSATTAEAKPPLNAVRSAAEVQPPTSEPRPVTPAPATAGPPVPATFGPPAPATFGPPAPATAGTPAVKPPAPATAGTPAVKPPASATAATTAAKSPAPVKAAPSEVKPVPVPPSPERSRSEPVAKPAPPDSRPSQQTTPPESKPASQATPVPAGEPRTAVQPAPQAPPTEKPPQSQGVPPPTQTAPSPSSAVAQTKSEAKPAAPRREVAKPRPAPAKPATSPTNVAVPAPPASAQPVSPPPAAAPVAVSIPAPAPAPPPVEEVPTLRTHTEKLLIGLGVLTVPRAIGHALGLFEIGGGGRAQWLFADADTLWFDGALLLAAIALVLALRRGTWRSPALGVIIVANVTLTLMLAYTVTNFGTLFRHRGMMLMGLILVPLLVANELARTRTPIAAETELAEP
jgi:hypothetical protein